jgi:hypothetical protein
MRAAVRVTCLLAALAAASTVALAQWLQLPLPGTPRAKDGKPNLAAPAPRTADGKPDLTGIWEYHRWSDPARAAAAATALTPPPEPVTLGVPAAPPGGGGLKGLLQNGDRILFQPWAEALYKQRQENNGIGLPSEHCLPHGPPGALMIPIPFKILQTPAEVAILFEEFNYYRQIHTDGRSHPQSMNPAWYGYSVGKWDKDTLVVDTVGFNDLTWLDVSGYPHSQDLHTIERITRPDFGHMDISMRIDDPKAYKEPWTILMHFDLQPDTELIEHVCDNERDARHMVGK